MPSLAQRKLYRFYSPPWCVYLLIFINVSAKCVCFTAGIAIIGAVTGVSPGRRRPALGVLCHVKDFGCHCHFLKFSFSLLGLFLDNALSVSLTRSLCLFLFLLASTRGVCACFVRRIQCTQMLPLPASRPASWLACAVASLRAMLSSNLGGSQLYKKTVFAAECELGVCVRSCKSTIVNQLRVVGMRIASGPGRETFLESKRMTGHSNATQEHKRQCLNRKQWVCFAF